MSISGTVWLRFAVFGILAPLWLVGETGSPAEQAPVPHEAVFDRLKAGNGRFAQGTPAPVQPPDMNRALGVGQRPFVTIVSCSDSLVAVEQLFDQGAGAMFSVRVMGHVVTAAQLGSVEFGVERLGTRAVVVLGHTRCSAVQAAQERRHAGGNLESYIAAIRPAVDRARRQNPGASAEELLRASVAENVWLAVERILTGSEPVRRRVATGEVRVVGAVLDGETGRVNWLGDHPRMAELAGIVRVHR